MTLVAYLDRLLEGMVHDSVGRDRLEAMRHRQFLGTQLGIGLIVLCLFPLWLATGAPFGSNAVVILAGLLSPIAAAAVLSLTGNLAVASLVSAAGNAGLVFCLCRISGGLTSPFLMLLPLVPLESAFAGSRTAFPVSAGFAGLVLALLLMTGPESAASAGATSVAIAIAVALYAAALAYRSDRLARFGMRMAREAEGRYRALADHATELVTRHAADGDVIFASPAARTLTGSLPTSFLGDGFLRRVHVADRPSFLKALSDARMNGGEVRTDLRLYREPSDSDGSGSYVDVEIRCLREREADGHVVTVTRDVSEQRRRERQMHEAQETAERADLAKTRYLAEMSHELRTPLNAIIGFAELLRDGGGAGREKEYAGLIHASGNHLLEIVNGILDMSRIEVGTFEIAPEKAAILPLLDDCCATLERLASERGVRLSRMPCEDLPEVSLDARAFRQILFNLLSNAIKFTGRNGQVTVGAHLESHNVAVFVRDTGIGIAAEDLPRLGTPFVQTDQGRKQEGTGLGLSTVRGLAALHGGRLILESRPGEGTTATVILPVNAEESPADTTVVGLPVQKSRLYEERKSA